MLFTCCCPKTFYSGLGASGGLVKGIISGTFPGATIWETATDLYFLDVDRIGGYVYAANQSAFQRKIYRVDFDGNVTELIASYSAAFTLSEIRVCHAYDSLFFTFVDLGVAVLDRYKIYRSDLDGSNFGLFVNLGSAIGGIEAAQPAGLAQHADTGDLYTACFVTTSPSDKKWKLCRIPSSGGSVTIINADYGSDGVRRWCLDIDYANSQIWTVGATGGPLYKGSLAGGARSSVSVGGGGINTIQCNHFDGRVYYHTGVNQIWRIDYDGSNNIQVGTTPSSLSGYHGYLSEDFPTDGFYGTS